MSRERAPISRIEPYRAHEPRLRPFDLSGVERDAGGLLRYADRPPSLVALLRASVERSPTREAVVEPKGERLSYTELWERAARIAGGLRREGVRRGDRVAIRLGNGVNWCLAFFGAQLAGAVAVPINVRLAPVEIDWIVADCAPRFTFLPDRPLPEGPALALDDLQPDDVAALYYTSGTTGHPKGAITTHGNFVSSTESVRRARRLGRDEELRTLISVPLFHVTGSNSNLLTTLDLGGTAVILPKFEVQSFLQTIAAERITMMTAVPAIYWLALEQDNLAEFALDHVRVATYGGAPCPPELVRRLRKALPNARLGNGFGLTESSALTSFLPDEWALERAESVGFAVPCAEFSLFEQDPETGVGELLVRGANVVAGYWGNEAATREAFRDGWLHTGDLARLDDDGFLQIMDRKKDMVNRGGENVYCVAVENALVEHPAVFEAAVLGVPDPMMGEKVGAVVVPRPGRELDVGDLIGFARERLADFEVPQYVALRTEPLPRNPNGKVLKPRLRGEVQWGEPLR